MNYKKSLLVAAAIATIGGAGILGSTAANAQGSSNSLVERVASKFNLNKDEVQAVFDEEHDVRQAERKAEFSEDLQKKVDAGTITAEQKTLIDNKMKELEATRETARDELEAWADENSIDKKYLHGHGPRGDNRLDNAVESGDITTDQKALIEAKQNKLKEKHEAEREALEAWADENNIDLKDVMPFGGGHGDFKGMRKMR